MFMRKNRISISLPLCFFYVLIISFTSSCISNKSVIYFSNLPDTTKLQLDKLQPPATTVQVNDVLEINIGGENEQTVQYIHTYFTGGSTMKAMVDLDGNIELPKVGKIHVAGLSKDNVKDTLTKAYKEFLVNPLIQINFGNFHFTVLGEVGSPGSFDIPAEKITILEALAHAGDLTSYSERSKVKVIRDINGNREIISIDLTDKAALNSADYYINRYDIIYVTAKKVKETNENIQRVTPYIGLVASLLAIIVLISN